MPVIRAILISVIVHFISTWVLVWLAPRYATKPPETIEVSLFPEGQILDALTPKKKQVVRQTLIPEKLRAPDDETLARFLSDKKQRVREETQAAKSGMTANRNNQDLSTQNTSPQKPNSINPHSVNMDKDGYRTVDISSELQEMNRFKDGMSTIGESMPRDMKVGSFTALNTDRYLFYTFYSRIEELIRYRWETKVLQAIHSFDTQTLLQAGDRNWVTHVEFLLDRDGFLRQALIMKESGIPPFDVAAINSFKEAKIFPNPPPEMVQEDGFIHVKYSFTVNFRPPTLVNRN